MTTQKDNTRASVCVVGLSLMACSHLLNSGKIKATSTVKSLNYNFNERNGTENTNLKMRMVRKIPSSFYLSYLIIGICLSGSGRKEGKKERQNY